MKKCGDVLLSLLLLNVKLNLTFMENVSTTVTNLTFIEYHIRGISVDVLDTNTGSGMTLLLPQLREFSKTICTLILAVKKITMAILCQILSLQMSDIVVMTSSAQWIQLVTELKLTPNSSKKAVLLTLFLQIHSDLLGAVKKEIVLIWELNGAHLLEMTTVGWIWKPLNWPIQPSDLIVDNQKDGSHHAVLLTEINVQETFGAQLFNAAWTLLVHKKNGMRCVLNNTAVRLILAQNLNGALMTMSSVWNLWKRAFT
jgi:hypothetical protein